MNSSPHPVDSFMAFAQTSRSSVDAALARALPAPPLCPPAVAAAMRYGVMSPGKRMRPLLTLAAAETTARANAGTSRQLREARDLAMPAACAVEFIHCHSLIHDDLPAMDNDTLRRGRPAVHVAFGEAIAILAGDGLLAEAFALLANEPDDRDRPQIADRKLRVLKRVGHALGAAGMLGGQAMDLALAGRVKGEAGDERVVDASMLRDMHERKTSALMRAAACAGAIMAGATAAQVAAMDSFATQLGLAFQIVDDILDAEGTPLSLGKTNGKDRLADKPTYPALFGLGRSRELADACVQNAQAALADSGLPLDLLMPLARFAVSRRH